MTKDTKPQPNRSSLDQPEKPECGSVISLQVPPLLQELTEEERVKLEKKLVRKMDLRLMPMLVAIYILNYLDRNAIAAARLAGLETELGLTNVQYQTCVSILFVGYILMQVPSNAFLNKIGKPAIYLPSCMIVWGIICGASGGVQNYAGLLTCRFFLGFVEAVYFPGCMSTLSAWYTRKELSFRTAILYSGSLLSGAFSGLIAAGVTDRMDGVRGILAWRWLFIIEGSITVFIAFTAYFILPNFPPNTKGISEQERQLAMWRLERDIGVEDWVSSEDQSLFGGFKQCLVDWKTWFLVVLIFGAVSSGTISSFFPSVVQTLGKGRIETLLLTAPPYLLSCLVAMAVSHHADKTGERYYHFTIPLWISVAGFIISAATTSLAPRYFAMMIMLPGVYTAFIIGITWVANTLPRPVAKRAAALAFANACSNCAAIYGPYLYPNSGAPRYILAMGVNAATSVLSIITATVLVFLLKRLNDKMDREDEAREDPEGPPRSKFRYLV